MLASVESIQEQFNNSLSQTCKMRGSEHVIGKRKKKTFSQKGKWREKMQKKRMKKNEVK